MELRLPPIWLMGLANLPFSMSSTVLLITVPQLLAARHVPEPMIASITAFALIPGFTAFVVSPILDVRFSRRTYAIVMAVASALCTLAALASLDNLTALRWLLFLASAAATVFQGALGGWLASIVPKNQDSRLGVWFVVANIAGFGVDAILNITLYRTLVEPYGILAISALIILPLTLLIPIPAPGADRRLARESFAQFFGDLSRMVRRPTVVRTLLIFAMPAACFTLTNMLGGLGTDYHVSEKFVGLVAGVGVTFVGILGSLIVPALASRFGPYRLYITIGAVGALFTLSLVLLTQTPATFALAMVGENIAQAAAFATANAIIFREIGKDNPLAATEFTVLTSAVIFPLSYVQWADGQGYSYAGLTGALLMDGALGLVGCIGILLLLMRWPRWKAQRILTKSYARRMLFEVRKGSDKTSR